MRYTVDQSRVWRLCVCVCVCVCVCARRACVWVRACRSQTFSADLLSLVVLSFTTADILSLDILSFISADATGCVVTFCRW